jgi:DNA-binding transcriptional LysR family regulator
LRPDLHDLEAADEAAGALQLTPRGQRRVYRHQGIVGFVAPIVTGFLARYPEASVDLRTGEVVIDLVQEGFDLAITQFPPPDSTLVGRRLATTHTILCCAPAYLEKHPAPQCPADLAAHNCLRYAYTPFGDNWPFLDAGGNPVVARVSGNLIATDRETLRAAAIAGIGLWLAPPYMIFDLLASGALVPLLPDYQASELEIVALYPHRRHMTAKLRAFIDMLVDEFANQQRGPGTPAN